MAAYVEGIENIAAAERSVALNYFEDGSVDAACPPLQALLHIMAHGSWNGKSIDDPGLRGMFTREAMIGSDWYRERLKVKQERDIALWGRHVTALDAFRHGRIAPGLRSVDVEGRLKAAEERLTQVSHPEYWRELEGTIGADPFRGQS
jgi:hypothetical protein